MALWQNGAEGGDNGVAITAANSGTSGDAFSLVNIGGGGSVVYSTAQAAFGGKSMLFSAATSASALIRWSQTDTTHRFRAYIRLPSFPTSAVNIVQLRGSAVGTGMGLQVNGSGNLLWTDGGGAAQTLYGLSINTWYMISAMTTRGTTTSNGYIKAEVRNASGTTVLGTFESSTRNTGIDDLTFTQFGKLTSSNPDLTIYFDQVAFDVGAGALIGPYVSGEPQLNLVHDTYHVVDATGSIAGTGGSLTYTATWVSGPTLTYTQPQPGLFFFTQNTSAPSAYTITVNEVGSTTDSIEITVPAGTLGTQTINNSAPLYPISSVPGSTWG